MIYGLPFGVDAGFGDVLTQPPEIITGTRFLEFVGVNPASLWVYPREAHLAEKLHAYTLPRPRENTRVKDLPDIALLAQTGAFEGAQVRLAIEQTFTFRKTHPMPMHLPEPPLSWAPVYARIAAEDNLPWRTMEEVESAACAFVDPVLTGGAGIWDPASWKWTP